MNEIRFIYDYEGIVENDIPPLHVEISTGIGVELDELVNIIRSFLVASGYLDYMVDKLVKEKIK